MDDPEELVMLTAVQDLLLFGDWLQHELKSSLVDWLTN